MIIGAPHTAKSWLAYDLALSVATGRMWLGIAPDVTGRVLICNYDNPEPEVGRRFKRLGMTAADPIHFHSCLSAPLQLPRATDELAGIVSRLRPVLIVYDSFRQAHTADENDSGEMADLMGRIKRIGTRSGAASVIVHHVAKASEGAITSRGAGEIDGSADARIVVAGDTATWTKHRTWPMKPADEPIHFEVVDVGEATQLRRKVPPAKKPAA
jgi:RecA-family ATPase